MAYTAYQIVTGQGPDGIATAVTAAIADGWQPLGAVRHTGIANYAQAMVKGTADSGSGSDSYTLPAATTSALGGVIVGDNLTVDATGKLSGAAAYTLTAATTSALGGVKMAANQANAGASTATDVTTAVTDLNTLATKYNALLAALQTAGIMAGATS